jgi:hypothetical protein
MSLAKVFGDIDITTETSYPLGIPCTLWIGAFSVDILEIQSIKTPSLWKHFNKRKAEWRPEDSQYPFRAGYHLSRLTRCLSSWGNPNMIMVYCEVEP